MRSYKDQRYDEKRVSSGGKKFRFLASACYSVPRDNIRRSVCVSSFDWRTHAHTAIVRQSPTASGTQFGSRLCQKFSWGAQWRSRKKSVVSRDRSQYTSLMTSLQLHQYGSCAVNFRESRPSLLLCQYNPCAVNFINARPSLLLCQYNPCAVNFKDTRPSLLLCQYNPCALDFTNHTTRRLTCSWGLISPNKWCCVAECVLPNFSMNSSASTFK